MGLCQVPNAHSDRAFDVFLRHGQQRYFIV